MDAGEGRSSPVDYNHRKSIGRHTLDTLPYRSRADEADLPLRHSRDNVSCLRLRGAWHQRGKSCRCSCGSCSKAGRMGRPVRLGS